MICMYVYIYIYIQIHVHIYIYTHTYIKTNWLYSDVSNYNHHLISCILDSYWVCYTIIDHYITCLTILSRIHITALYVMVEFNWV